MHGTCGEGGFGVSCIQHCVRCGCKGTTFQHLFALKLASRARYQSEKLKRTPILQGGAAAWAAWHRQDVAVQGAGAEAGHPAGAQVSHLHHLTAPAPLQPRAHALHECFNLECVDITRTVWIDRYSHGQLLNIQTHKHTTHKTTHRYSHGQLVEVNAHSLFSKWFSESGKLVGGIDG